MKITLEDISKKMYSSKTLKELKNFDKRDDLTTGIPYIDRDFSFPVGYYVILGNPGVGKSWFALWLSRVFYRHNGMSSVYFTLEMPEQILRSRILQQWSDLTKTAFESGGDFSQALALLGEDVIVVDDFYTENTKYQTPQMFLDWIKEYYSLGYRIFHFDHLHELAGANDNSRNQAVTESWAKTFQKVCKDYPDIWLFVYAQPNGAAANKRILRRTDIAGSKAITQKCDFFLSLNRNIELDENGLLTIDSNDRQIILYLDKTRYTEKVHIGFKLHFSETANYHSIIKEPL